MRRSRKQIGYVYFTREVGGEAIKIGYTCSLPTQRVTSLAVERGVTLELIGVVVGDKKIESEILRQFADLRIEGEWFRADDELETFIAGLSYGGEQDLKQLIGLRFDHRGRMDRERTKSEQV